MMFKLALNAGHGLPTAGRRCLKSLDPNQTQEWTLNSRICNKIEAKLQAYTGYQVLRLDDTTGKTDVPLKTRTDNANKFGADFYLAIHHNGGIAGGTVYAQSKAGSTEQAWQKELYDAIIQKTGLKGNRATPLAKADLHECRESAMPAVLLECGFMDSKTDAPVILTDAYADKVATACVEVIVKRAGLAKKPTPTPTPTQTTGKLYRVQVGAYAVKSNAEAMKQKLTQAGFPAIIVEADK